MLFLHVRKSFDDVISRYDAQFSRLAQVHNALLVIAQEDVGKPPVEISLGELGI